MMEGMSDGVWDDQSWVRATLEKYRFKNVQLKTQSVPMKWENVQEFLDTSFPKMSSMFVTKTWSKEDQDRFGSLLIPALEKYLVDKYGHDAGFEFKMVAIIATGEKGDQ